MSKSIAVILTVAALATGALSLRKDQLKDGLFFKEDLRQLADQWYDIGIDVLEPLLFPESKKLSQLINNTSGVDISSTCQRSLGQVAEGLNKSQLWAIEMLDSSGTHGSGFLRRWVDLGDFDTCLDISNSQSTSLDHVHFTGQYCLVQIIFALPTREQKDKIESVDLSIAQRHKSGHWLQRGAEFYKMLYISNITFSLCVPSTCQPEEIEKVINNLLPPNLQIMAVVDPLGCSHTDPSSQVTSSSVHLAQKIAQVIVFTLTAIVALSLIIISHGPSWLIPFVSHFDLASNTRKLTAQTSDPLAAKLIWVHGARVLYLILAMSFHMTTIAALWTPHTHSRYVFSKYSLKFPLWSEFFANMTIGISVNFTIGGMLAFVSWFPEMARKNGQLSLAKYILGRWVRTLPLVAGAILLVISVPPTFASGPVWKIGWSKVVNNCLANWWYELIYASNLLPLRSACLPYAWYLSVDMQLYVLSFVLMVALTRSLKLGLIIAFITSFVSIIYHGMYLHVNSLKYTADYNTTDIERLLTKEIVLHTGTFNYVSSYTIGIVVGYLIAKGYVLQSKYLRSIGWIIFVSLGLSIHLIPLVWKANNGPTSRFVELIFGALQRAVYSAAFAYGFLQGSNGQAGFINVISELPIWTPLGRLSSSMFIGHFFVIWFDVFTSRSSFDFTIYSSIKRLVCIFVFTLFIGYYIYIVFEAPCINLGKSLIMSKSKNRCKEVKDK